MVYFVMETFQKPFINIYVWYPFHYGYFHIFPFRALDRRDMMEAYEAFDRIKSAMLKTDPLHSLRNSWIYKYTWSLMDERITMIQ